MQKRDIVVGIGLAVSVLAWVGPAVADFKAGSGGETPQGCYKSNSQCTHGCPDPKINKTQEDVSDCFSACDYVLGQCLNRTSGPANHSPPTQQPPKFQPPKASPGKAQ